MGLLRRVQPNQPGRPLRVRAAGARQNFACQSPRKSVTIGWMRNAASASAANLSPGMVGLQSHLSHVYFRGDSRSSHVLSQVYCVLSAIRERKKQFLFTDGTTVALDNRVGFFITMNPGASFTGFVGFLPALRTSMDSLISAFRSSRDMLSGERRVAPLNTLGLAACRIRWAARAA